MRFASTLSVLSEDSVKIFNSLYPCLVCNFIEAKNQFICYFSITTFKVLVICLDLTRQIFFTITRCDGCFSRAHYYTHKSFVTFSGWLDLRKVRPSCLANLFYSASPKFHIDRRYDLIIQMNKPMWISTGRSWLCGKSIRTSAEAVRGPSLCRLHKVDASVFGIVNKVSVLHLCASPSSKCT